MMRANRLSVIVWIGIFILSGGSFSVKVMAWEDAPSVKEMCHNCDEDSGSAQSDSSDRLELRQQMQSQQQEDAQFKQEMSRKYAAYDLHREGIVYAGQGNWEMALSYYKKAYELYPQDEVIKDNYYQTYGYLLNEQGNRYYEQGDFALALESYRQAVEFRPQDTQTRLNLNNAQEMLQRQSQNQLQDKLQLERAAREAYRATESSRKSKEAGNDSSGRITSFEHMHPDAPALEPVGTSPVGEHATASAQARSAQFHGQKAMEKLSKEAASEEARKIFDTPGEAKEPLKPFKLRGMPLAYPDPVIAEEERNEVINNLEKMRDQAREKRSILEVKLTELEKASQKDTVAIARTKQEISNNRNKEHFYNFKITRTLEKARELRRSDALD